MISLGTNPKIILKILSYLKGGSFAMQDITEGTGIPYQTILEVLEPFIEQGYMKRKNGNFVSSEGAIISLAVQAIKDGASFNEVFNIVRWQDFENFIEMILSEYGYKTFRNYRLKKPRIEVDILALRKSYALLIDCKQWHKILGPSNLSSIVTRQVERAKIILSHDKKLLKGIILVPVIVTLFPSNQKYFNGVPIVSCDVLKSFVSEVDGRLNEFLKVSIEGESVSEKI